MTRQQKNVHWEPQKLWISCLSVTGNDLEGIMSKPNTVLGNYEFN